MVTATRSALAIALIGMTICAIGCDELGLKLGPGRLPDPVPLDQTAAAAIAMDTEQTLPNSTSSTIPSPSDGSEEAPDTESENNRVEREPLKHFRDWTMAETAIDSLGRLGEKAVPPLVTALDDDNPLVRYRAAIVLARIGPDAVEAVPALIRHLNDVDESVRRAAARAIGQIGPAASDAVPHLINALKSDEAS